MDIAEKFQKIGVVPVVVLEDAKDAVPLAKALVEGGLSCAEVTFRTEAAEESIRLMTEQFPEMLVGAGTVLTREQVDAAVLAGAKFIVSPGFDPEIVDYCLEKKIPVFPGCITPSEVAQAVKRGLKVVKFFRQNRQAELPCSRLWLHLMWELSLCPLAVSMQKIWKIIFPLTKLYAAAEAGW